jgi:hypothetical protein
MNDWDWRRPMAEKWKVCRALTNGKICWSILTHRRHRRIGKTWYYQVGG